MKKFILLSVAFISYINSINAQCSPPQYPPEVSRYDQCGGSSYWFYEGGSNGITVEIKRCRYIFMGYYCSDWETIPFSSVFVESGYPDPAYVRLRNSCGPGPQGYFEMYGYGPPGLCDAPINDPTLLADNNIGISVFPNPVADILTVKTDKGITATYKITLYDMLGKLVENNVVEAGNAVEIDVRRIENGIYSLFIDNGLNIQREKITVTH